ncbi:FFLEELY motif protein [Piscinibacter sp. HJYY11]|uniref:FFLEELY motif protein n=1 Tax=Piscinibacter sp. HJYY11 TaxID=2801333 RepID=UPI00191D8F62|nr:hypothetical protein [Piscinibacter sp. HJYY11]MBL0728452.1 hypothetical protein [Piscinibacter sp. HJYY11]
MPTPAALILAHLETVERERRTRAATPALQARVQAVKAYQQRRFSHTYADLLKTPRYGAAARFFLDELYGPGDFSQRDAQFARVVPALVRLFPRDVVDTVATLAQLHALSEELDSAMGTKVPDEAVDAGVYLNAWRHVGRLADRQQQIELTLAVGRDLYTLTRKPLLRHSLRMMRGPARAAGLSALQGFLESGFDTFQAMRGAEEFLATVSASEQTLLQALFGAESAPILQALGQLP